MRRIEKVIHPHGEKLKVPMQQPKKIVKTL